MAQQAFTEFGVLSAPGAYVQQKVESNPVQQGLSGVVVVIGESDSGPGYAEEASLGANAFGPDSIARIRAKYGSGPLVDACAGMVAASNDPQIQASFSRVVPVKVNGGSKGTASVLAIGGGTYGTLTARSGGRSGNLVARSVASARAEVVPTTGAFLLAPPQVSTDVAFRANGGAAVTATLGVGALPSSTVSTINALAGVAATGGTNRSVITAVAGTLAMVVDSGFQCHVDITGATFANAPTVGDLVYIPTGSPFAVANEGTYVCTAATTSRIDLYKLLDAAGAGSARTAPTAESGLAVAATTDLAAFAPVTVSLEAAAVSAGLGKSLEVANSGSASFSNVAFVFASATSSPPAAAATWVSVSGTPAVIASSAEYRVSVTASRQSDGVSDTVSTGGDVLLAVGYTGTTASMTIASGVLTTTVTGGSGANQTVTLRDYPTVADLATYLSTLAGYTAAPGSAAAGQRPATDLDPGTYGFGTTQGAKTGRIKGDAARFSTDVNAGLSLASFAAASGASGLPDVNATAYLAGGARGGSSDADWAAALEAVKRVRCNFVVACVSQDASLDVAAGLTESASTYTVAAVGASLRSHVIACRAPKAKRSRQGAVGFRGTFAAAKEFASNMATGFVTVAFQDVVDTDSLGNLRQFQPWMAVAKAVGMQAGGGYQPIVNKMVNVSGALQAAGDFDPENLSDVEDALKAGLIVIGPEDGGGFKWVSDQTSYTRDSNFVYNSLQANYVADLFSAGLQKTCDRAFVGQSVADVSAASARMVVEQYCDEQKRNKYIAPSTDAPKGYKDLSVTLEGPVMTISLNAKLAGAIYFVPITVTFSMVRQSA